MRTVVLTPRHGEIKVEEIPAPVNGPGRILIANQYSLISAGTERATVAVGQQSLVGKARQRPDQAKQVLKAVREQGLVDTYRLVADRLDAPMTLGYSCAGSVLEVAADVDDVRPGAVVAGAGAGWANHADVVSVPRTLCVPVPEGLDPRWAAMTTAGAIALQGIHQAGVEAGSRVAVIGLGLIGQLTARLLNAYGYDVIGIDRDPSMVAMAGAIGVTALAREEGNVAEALRRRWPDGADAILVTAATKSTDPIELAGELARDRATVVVVGDVTVAPPRPSYYGKELSVRFSRSYGPGRYDPRYELEGIEYPVGYVPWPQRRNMEEFLRLAATGRLQLESLSPIIVPVDQAAEAYALLDAVGEERRVAILLCYTEGRAEPVPVPTASPQRPWRRPEGPVRIATVGAGSFATKMLFPSLAKTPGVDFSWIATGGGLSAMHQGRRWNFNDVVGSLAEGLASHSTDAVMVVSRHDSHGGYASEVLKAGAALFCEKPLALDEDELESVVSAGAESGAPAMVGFNRRFAPLVTTLRPYISGRPSQMSYRVFAGRLDPGHWYFDRAQGGRLLGEVCHFIDLAIWLSGARPVRVTASTPESTSDPARAQSVSVFLELANGTTASILYGGGTPAGPPKEHLSVAGDGLAAELQDFKTLRVWTRGEAATTHDRRGDKGHGAEMEAFVHMIRSGASGPNEWSTSVWSSLATIRAAAALASGRPEAIEPSTPAVQKLLGLREDGVGVSAS